MANVQTPSITIPPALMTAVEAYASDACETVDSVVEKALRFYICETAETNSIRLRHQERAASLGIDIDMYMAALIKEWRQEDREEDGQRAASCL